MPNRPRGDGALVVDGRKRTIRLTLGAIAEIEDDLDVGLSELGDILSSGRIRPISTILYWMLRAGGWDDLDKADMLKLDIDMTQMMPELSRALSKFGGEDEAKSPESGDSSLGK